jgi:hypothetical protein
VSEGVDLMHVYTNRRLLTRVKVFYFFHMGAVDASKLGHNFDQQDQRRTEMSNKLARSTIYV